MSEPPLQDASANLYFDRGFDRDGAKILPGEYYVTDRDMVLVTVLGSCVAACIRDSRSGIGGMNHFMLPDIGADRSPMSASARYGGYAMEVLINQIIKRGGRRENLEAKVFGGGNVLKALNSTNIGHRNAGFVRDFLKTERIRVLAEDLGDVCARKVCYFPQNGKAMIKKMLDTRQVDGLELENVYSSRLTAAPVGGDVELFG